MPASTSSTTSKRTRKAERLSLNDALAFAIRLQQQARWDDAATIYRTILGRWPDCADAVHYSGVVAHQQGRSDEAVTLIERSLELDPGQADWHSNLGNVLQSRGKLDQAIAAYGRAIALNPDHANAHSNVGVLLKARGQETEAEAAYRTAIRLNPQHADAHTNLGILLFAQKRTREAVVCYCKAMTLRPSHPDARRHLAMAYFTIGEIAKATAIFAEWLVTTPNDPVARHMLAACSGQDVPARASDRYLEATFDSFADSFDAKLARLSYRAPSLIVDLLTVGLEPSKSLIVLDAGCGTGLCGPLVAPFARRLVGVDLSARMIAHATARGVYDELAKMELTAYLRGNAAAFDVILSADTLVYFGALADVIDAAARALRPAGQFVFTVEELAGGENEPGFRINPHGRYSHSRRYVEQELTRAQLLPTILSAELRTEAGAPVAGLVVLAAKPPH